METNHFSLDWDIPCAGLIFCYIVNCLFIPEGSLVGDDWNFTGLSCGDCLVLGLVNCVDSSISLSSVLGFVLNSKVLIEYSVVSSLSLLSVKDFVLVGVANFWLFSVFGDGIRSLKDFNFSSVSVFDLILVKDFVVGLVGYEWDIFPVGLGVVSVDLNWLPGVSGVDVWSVQDLIFSGVSHLTISTVFGFFMSASSGNWDLSGSHFSLSFGLDVVLDFVVLDNDVSVSDILTVRGVGVFVRLVIVATSRGNSGKNGSNEFHGWKD